MRAPLSGCAVAELLAQRHQAGHLVLGELDLLAAEVGEADVGHLVVGRRRRHRGLHEGRGSLAPPRRPAASSASPAPSAASRAPGRARDARRSPRSQASTAPRSSASCAEPQREGDVGEAELVLARAARAACAAAAARRGRRGGSRRRSARARRARRARRSAACAATSRSSGRPRGSSGRPSVRPRVANPDTVVSRLRGSRIGPPSLAGCAPCRPARRSSSSSSRTPASRSASACPASTTSPLWEALRESPIRLVGVRHEQAAAYAADGYARATGKLGVALTTTGPGRGEHARRGRGGVGVALADPRDRDRHPDHAAARRACTAACCTRPTGRPTCSGR